MSYSVLYEPKVDFIDKNCSPDLFYFYTKYIPHNEFVVSRNRDGSIASVFSDFQWDWSAYHPYGRKTIFDFNNWCGGNPSLFQLNLIKEMQFFLFALVWLRQEGPVGHATINSYYLLFKKLAIFCCKTGTSKLSDVLSNPAKLINFYDGLSNASCVQLRSLINSFLQLGPQKIGFSVIAGKNLTDLQFRIDSITAKQHPPIPTKIYSTFISNLISELDDFENVSDSYLNLLSACIEDPLLGKDRPVQVKVSIRLDMPHTFVRPNFSKLMENNPDIRVYLQKKGLLNSIKGLSKGLRNIQFITCLLIQTFSGMRLSETENLPFDCLQVFEIYKKSHYLINGHITKFNHGRLKKAQWVTNKDGARAIIMAKKIADTIYKAFESNLKSKRDRKLFISTAFLMFNGISRQSINTPNTVGKFSRFQFDDVVPRIAPTITEKDILELERVDPFRDWRNDGKFKIGQMWPFTTHQLRRSLALYASRSGLVSLPSLRRQLQHITEEMARYYASGSTFSDNFIADNRGHFGLEYREAQSESQYLSYIANVILSDERLFGAHGTWTRQHHQGMDINIIAESRDTTLLKFRKGELAYKETMLGGCIKVGNCDKRALRWIPACLSCKDFVGKLSKLEKVINAQNNLLKGLDPNSLEWKVEKSDFDALVVMHSRVTSQNMSGQSHGR